MLSYAQTTSDKWYVKTVGKNAMGSPTICIYDSATKAPPAFCLYAKEECGTVVFPLEPRKEADPPAFMTGAIPTKKVESLDLITTLEGAQADFVKSVDARPTE